MILETIPTRTMIKEIKFGSERERTIEVIYKDQSKFVKSKKITVRSVSGDAVVSPA